MSMAMFIFDLYSFQNGTGLFGDDFSISILVINFIVSFIFISSDKNYKINIGIIRIYKLYMTEAQTDHKSNNNSQREAELVDLPE